MAEMHYTVSRRIQIWARQGFDCVQRGAVGRVGVNAVCFILRLKGHPKPRACAEVTGQPRGGVGGQGGLRAGQPFNAAAWHTNVPRDTSSGQLQGDHEFLSQNFARVNGGGEMKVHGASLVVVRDLDVVGAIVVPVKTNTPLPIDTNRILTRTIANKTLKPIRRRLSQIFKALCGLQHPQTSPRRLNDVGGKSFWRAILKKVENTFVFDRPNHPSSVSWTDTHFNTYTIA